MPIRLKGHAWSQVPSVWPCVLQAMEAFEAGGSPARKCRSPNWVLDYTFTPYGFYRAGAPGAPWRERRARTALLYAPRTPYWEDLSSAGPSETDCGFIDFRGGEAAGLKALLLPRRGYAHFEDSSGRLGEMVRAAVRTGVEAGEKGYWQAQAVLCQILDLLHRCRPLGSNSYLVPALNADQLVESFAGQVEWRLRQGLAERLTLAALAHELHVSPSALSHRYHLETGRTPMAVRREVRLNLAKGLLLKGYPLKAIAELTGFYDMFHLSKAFKRAVGVSPLSFRRSLHGGAVAPPPHRSGRE